MLSGPGNPLAYLALALVIPTAFLLFWRMPARKAALIVMLGGSLFLPAMVGFDLPLFPDFDKEILPGLGALIACVVLRRRELKSRPFSGPEALLLFAVLGAFGTVLTNGDVIVHGPVVLPAQSPYDGLADATDILLRWFPPYYLGRALFRTRADLRMLCRYLVLAGLIYTLPILVELRMSPQFHIWVYGFHPGEFAQTERWGGYRPVVFMRHGLNVAAFMTIVMLVALGMWRAKVSLGFRRLLTPGPVFGYLLVILIFCKSTGAYFYALALMPLVYFASTKWQRVGIGLFVGFILGWPMIRAADLIPVDALTEIMREHLGDDRANSMWFRFFTEDQVLDNVRERLVFGWGGYFRPFEHDEVTGEALSIVDGHWLLEIGKHGLVGFFCIFGLVLWPVVTAARKLPLIDNRADRQLIATLAACMALYVWDWVPNSTLSAGFTFVCGALMGLVPGLLDEQKRKKRAALKQKLSARRESLASPEPRGGPSSAPRPRRRRGPRR